MIVKQFTTILQDIFQCIQQSGVNFAGKKIQGIANPKIGKSTDRIKSDKQLKWRNKQ